MCCLYYLQLWWHSLLSKISKTYIVCYILKWYLCNVRLSKKTGSLKLTQEWDVKKKKTYCFLLIICTVMLSWMWDVLYMYYVFVLIHLQLCTCVSFIHRVDICNSHFIGKIRIPPLSLCCFRDHHGTNVSSDSGDRAASSDARATRPSRAQGLSIFPRSTRFLLASFVE